MPCAAPLASLRRLPQGTLSVRLLVLLCCSCVSSADLPDDSQPPGAAHQSELELGGRRLPFIVYERGVPTVYRQVERSLLPCNLVFIKVTKCASSTTGGVVRRIAAHNNLSGVSHTSFVDPEPGIWANHGHLDVEMQRNNHWRGLQQRVFLLTMVRLPAPRCLSEYYHFKESREGAVDTAEAKLAALQGCSDTIFKYIRPSVNTSYSDPQSLVRSTYSFVGVVERYDESMVLLASMLRLPLSQVLYLKSKDSQNNDRGPKNGLSTGVFQVPHPPIAEEPLLVRQEAASERFRKRNKNDFALHTFASAELDRRWAANRAELDEQLVRFKAMREKAESLCKGGDTKCYWRDNGCAYQCLDRLFDSVV